MKKTETILEYLLKTYQPDGIVLYGSYADGSANEHSDFDALVIAGQERKHDGSVIDGTVLDVFVYPPETFLSSYDPQEFVQIFDGKIVLDKTGSAERLHQRVAEHIKNIPPKTTEEIRAETAWCEKMLSRTARGDAEGCFRHHWLLYESLEIYCDTKGMRYCGPKKALRYMERMDHEAFESYSRALKEWDRNALAEWIDFLKRTAGEG